MNPATGALPWLWSGDPAWAEQVVALRWTLVGAALFWAWLAARGRRRAALLAGLLFGELALAFWVGSLARPYGLLEHPEVSRETAAAAVSAALGRPVGFVVGQPFGGGAWARLALWGVPESWRLNAPTVLPLLVWPLLGLALHALWRHPAAVLAAPAWILFASTELEALAGVALVPGLWSHPAGSLGVLAAVVGALAAERARSLAGRWVCAAAGLAGAVLAVSGSGHELGLSDAVRVLVVGPWPWWLLGAPAWGCAGPAARALVVGGGALLLGGGLGLPLDPWGAQALLRTGLLMLAACSIQKLSPWLLGLLRSEAQAAETVAPPVSGRAGARAAGLLLAALAPGSFLAWWHPTRLDDAAHASLTPVPDGLLAAMTYVRTHTPPDAVFLASPRWAAAVAGLGGRRLLHAPHLWSAPDDGRRRRVELQVLSQQPGGLRNARRYGLSHVFVGPEDGTPWPPGGRSVLGSARWRLLFTAPGGYAVYAWSAWGAHGAHE